MGAEPGAFGHLGQELLRCTASSQRPVRLPRKVWRVRHLGHPRGLPELTSSVTSYQVHIFLSDFGDRDSPEEERRNQSAGGACRAWMIGEGGPTCLQIERTDIFLGDSHLNP